MEVQCVSPCEVPQYAIKANRAIALLIITCKLTIFSAFMVLAISTKAVVNNLLLITDDVAKQLGKIPKAYQVLLVGLSLQKIFILVLGFYGFARLKRYFLASYAFYLILMIFWFIFFSITVTVEDSHDKDLTSLFKDFKSSERAKAAVYLYQEKYRCCGSEYHTSNDSEEERLSCCNEQNQSCSTKKPTILSKFKLEGVLQSRVNVAIGTIALTVIELLLVVAMLYYLKCET